MPNLTKYRNDLGGPPHHGHLAWPGNAQGLPIRTATPLPGLLLRGDEVDESQLVVDYYCKLFNLGDEKDRMVFADIMDRVSNGWYTVQNRIDRWPDDAQYPQIWLEWCQVYGELPAAILTAASNKSILS